MKVVYNLYINDKIKLKKVKMIEGSFLGHLRYGDTNKLILTTLKKYKKDKYHDLGNKVVIDDNGDIIFK